MRSPAAIRLRNYLEDHGIEIEIEDGPHPAVEQMEDGTRWDHYAYEIRLLNADLGTEMVIAWKHGTGITEGPDERPEEVIDCLISDAWGYENSRSFEEWAGEYGYDPDSRKAEQIYRTVKSQSEEFIDFLGGAREVRRLAQWDRL